MDERLQELLNNVQRTAIEVGSAMGDAFCAVGQKATELVQNGRARAQIVDLKTEVNIRLREIGEIVYGTHTGAPTDSDVLFSKLGQIDELQRRIAELEDQIRSEKEEEIPAEAVYVCPVCGAVAREGDVYCRECGARL